MSQVSRLPLCEVIINYIIPALVKFCEVKIVRLVIGKKLFFLYIFLQKRFFLVILSFHESKTTSDRQNPIVDILNIHRKIRRLKEIKKEVKNTRNYRTSTINFLILINSYLLIIMYNIIPPLV